MYFDSNLSNLECILSFLLSLYFIIELHYYYHCGSMTLYYIILLIFIRLFYITVSLQFIKCFLITLFLSSFLISHFFTFTFQIVDGLVSHLLLYLMVAFLHLVLLLSLLSSLLFYFKLTKIVITCNKILHQYGKCIATKKLKKLTK